MYSNSSDGGTLHEASQRLTSSLIQASREGDITQVKLLVDQWQSDSSLSVTSTDLQTALIRAGENNHPTVVSYLLDQGAVIDQDVIMNAVSGTSEAVWQVLLDHGWDINSNGCTGAPVLKHLVSNESLVDWFLEHGADPNIHGAKNECPLDVAANHGYTTVIDLLLQHGAKLECSNALHAIARTRSEDSECIPVMAHLLDRGADVNALEHQFDPDYFDQMKTHTRIKMGTPLHNAAFRGGRERVQFLLDRGADPTIRNTHGMPASANEYDETGIEDLLDTWRTKKS